MTKPWLGQTLPSEHLGQTSRSKLEKSGASALAAPLSAQHRSCAPCVCVCVAFFVDAQATPLHLKVKTTTVKEHHA